MPRTDSLTFAEKSIVAIEAGFQVPLRVNVFNQVSLKKFPAKLGLIRNKNFEHKSTSIYGGR